MTADVDSSWDPAALAIRHVLYPLWVAKSRSSLLKYLAKLEQSQYWSSERVLEYQWRLFTRLVSHAFETCPYYKSKYRALGITPADLQSPDDIQRIPTITKEEIQENRVGMISTLYQEDDLIQDMTGGSTGSPMKFCYDKDRFDSREATTLRHDRWSGWNIGDRCAVLWGAPRDVAWMSTGLKARLVHDIILRRQALDASSLDEACMAAFAQRLIRYRPVLILGYANALGMFARFLQAENIRGIHPRAIITSAEILTPENRRLIEHTFGCSIYNRYGCREFGVIASECSIHDGMHINADNLLVEVLPENREEMADTGEIVITDLRNLAMPMIRYRIRDVGRLKNAGCRCSRGLPLLELTGGRVSDFLTASNGKKVSGIVLATYVITNIPGIRQVQFVQSELGAVTINLVKGSDYSTETTSALLHRTRSFLGPDIQIRVCYKENIPSEKSGKYRFSISTLAER